MTARSRLDTLDRLFPEPACATCAARPAVVSILAGALEPAFPNRCPVCRRALPPMVLLIGADTDAI